MSGQNRADIYPGLEVEIVIKADQRTGTLTRGIVAEILTNSPTHPHGIKVRLTSGQVGRVQNIVAKKWFFWEFFLIKRPLKSVIFWLNSRYIDKKALIWYYNRTIWPLPTPSKIN